MFNKGDMSFFNTVNFTAHSHFLLDAFLQCLPQTPCCKIPGKLTKPKLYQRAQAVERNLGSIIKEKARRITAFI